MLFLDGDDGFSPNYLGRLYNTAIENSADMVLCGYKRINRQTMEVVATEMCNNPNRISVSQHEPLLQLVNPAPWNKLIRASVIGDCRFGLPLLEDVIFLTTLLPKCKRVAFVNEPLYDYYVTADSLISANAAQALPVLKNGLCDVANTYRNHPEIYLGFDDYLSAVAFMRVGIGATTRACVSPETQGKRRQIIRQSRRYLDQNFPGWRKNKFLSFRALSKRGLKGVLLWNCRLLYKRHMFGLFIFEYRLFTKLFKKDIKW